MNPVRGWLFKDGYFVAGHCTAEDCRLHGTATPLYDDRPPELHFFNSGEFTLHSGTRSSFKVDCDALTSDDWAALAVQVAARFRWSYVWGVPRGGQAFAQALKPYSVPCIELPKLIVDDVYTTGQSMAVARSSTSRPPIGVVVVARNETPSWIHPIFRLWGDAR